MSSKVSKRARRCKGKHPLLKAPRQNQAVEPNHPLPKAPPLKQVVEPAFCHDVAPPATEELVCRCKCKHSLPKAPPLDQAVEPNHPLPKDPPKQAVEPASCHDVALPASAATGRYWLQDLQVFQCSQCFALLGDSLSMCGEDANLACVVCLRVSIYVFKEKCFMFDSEGALAGSFYNRLSCRLCKMLLGFCLYSTDKHLAHLRGLFCLSKDKFCVYLFESKKTVQASEVKFSSPSEIMSKIEELKRKLVEVYADVRFLTSQRKELEAQKEKRDQYQGKIATDEMEKNSAEGPETPAVLYG